MIFFFLLGAVDHLFFVLTLDFFKQCPPHSSVEQHCFVAHRLLDLHYTTQLVSLLNLKIFSTLKTNHTTTVLK